jgi:serpin B
MNHLLTTKRLIMLVALPVFITSCGSPASPNGGQPTNIVLAQSKVQRETSPNVARPALDELSAGNSAFAFDLYQAIRDSKGNLFYSPYSISIALAMTYAGARGSTERQMADTLHYTLPQDQLHPAFNALDLKLTQQDSADQDKGSFKLNIANSLWGQTGYSFRPEFLDVIAKNYGAGLRLLDFKDAANREQSRLTINQWVSDQTAGKIKDLIAKDTLAEYTRLVLANAIYFKAEWQVPFLKPTRNDTFTLLNGDPISVPMMSRRTDTGYAEDTDYQAIELNYKGDRMRMVILLPAPGQFEAFERSLNMERANAILQALQSHDIDLSMPKFKYDASLSLGGTLAKMGMPDALSQAADFSGMDGTRNLYISAVVHKAFVAVDEIGTEAAAATAVVVGITSMPRVVTINRPFIFFIRDAETGTILFVGRVLDPR